MRFLLYFIKQVYKQWFLIFAAIIGIVSGVLTIFPIPSGSSTTNIIVFTFCLVISVFITLIIYQIKHIPDEEMWMLEIPREKPSIIFPYKKEYLKAASSLARSHYGKNSVSYETCRKWYEQNPLTLTVLADSHNKFVGYFDIIPLVPSFGRDLVSGTVMEKDIKPIDILPPNKMRDAEYIYIAGISVKDQLSQLGKKHGAILIYSTFIYLERFYDLSKPKKLFAIAATECGKNILEKLNFYVESDESNRKDGLDLYSRIITKDEIVSYRLQFDFCDNKFDYSAYSKAVVE
ncbi:MAG TPA: hypothetical protein PKY97_00570 [Saprospiraceae bacterium]|nr:hypothetical protein [Saprospiraceae bacterium]